MIKARSIIWKLLLMMVFLSSCKSELFLQRKYTNGKYRNDTYNASALSHSNEKKEKVILLKEVIYLLKEEKTEPSLLVSVTKGSILAKKHQRAERSKKNENNCNDTIVLTTGAKIVCKVTEISDNRISYQPCPAINYDHINLLPADIKYIRYQNGIIEKYNMHLTTIQVPASYKKQIEPVKSFRGESLGLAGSVIGIIGALIMAFAAPIAGILAAIALGVLFAFVHTRKNNNDLWKYKLANFPGLLIGILTIGFLSLCLIALIVVLLIGL